MSAGIPTVTFDIGESTDEEVINEKTGIIVYSKRKEDYIYELDKLMKDNNKLIELSKSAKKYNENFKIENIIKDWINLFKEIDKKGEQNAKSNDNSTSI